MTKTFDLVVEARMDGDERIQRDGIAWDADGVPELAVLPGGKLALKSGRYLTSGDVYGYLYVRHVIDLRGETPVITTTDEFMQPDRLMIPSLASLTPEERAKLDEMMADMPRNFGGGLIMPSGTPKEGWFYDGVSRTIYDENRLAVARDVGEADARTILQAVRSPAADENGAIDASPGPNPLFAILAEMLAYEAQAFEDDEEVDGGDMVEAFAQWREQLKAALAVARPAPLVALAREAAALFREYEGHHRAKASEAGRPEKAERNARIAGRLESVLAGTTPDKRQLFITVEGGQITSLFSPDDMSDVSATFIDYDTDGSERDELEMVSDGPGHLESALVRRDNLVAPGDAPKFSDAEDAEHDSYFGEG